jgi:hypothetical protein
MPTSDKAIIAQAAQKYGVDPKILWGLYGTETGFGKNVSTSSAGAVGPFQFEPATAKGMGVNPYDFKSAAFGAARYLAQYKARGVGGMLSAYNAGPAGGYQQRYVNTTLANAKTYDGSPGASVANAGETTVQLPGRPGRQASEPGFDEVAFRKASTGATVGSLFSAEDRKDNPLFTMGVLSTRAPSRSEYTTGSSPVPAAASVPGRTVSTSGTAPGGPVGAGPSLPGVAGAPSKLPPMPSSLKLVHRPPLPAVAKALRALEARDHRPETLGNVEHELAKNPAGLQKALNDRYGHAPTIAETRHGKVVKTASGTPVYVPHPSPGTELTGSREPAPLPGRRR